MLYREPKLLKGQIHRTDPLSSEVSVLYREPKLLKDPAVRNDDALDAGFSALP